MRDSRRKTYTKRELTQMVCHDLKEMNISERIVGLVLDSYLSCKKQALSSGGFVEEDGLGTMEILIRRVSETFSDRKFTVKLKTAMKWDFQNEVINKLETDDDFRDVMKFELPERNQ